MRDKLEEFKAKGVKAPEPKEGEKAARNPLFRCGGGVGLHSYPVELSLHMRAGSRASAQPAVQVWGRGGSGRLRSHGHVKSGGASCTQIRGSWVQGGDGHAPCADVAATTPTPSCSPLLRSMAVADGPAVYSMCLFPDDDANQVACLRFPNAAQHGGGRVVEAV